MSADNGRATVGRRQRPRQGAHPVTAGAQRWGPVVLPASAAMLVLAAIALQLAPTALPRPSALGSTAVNVFDYGGYLILAAVAGVITRRRPGNRVGWLLLGAAWLTAAELVVFEYAVLGLLNAPQVLPGAVAAAGLDTWLWMPGALFLVLALLHFPTGRLPSPRWRWTWWLVALQVTSVISLAIASTGADGPALLLEEAAGNASIDPFFVPSLSLLVGVFAVAAASLVVRFRHAGVTERQQLKWLALPVTLLVTIFAIETVIYAVAPAATMTSTAELASQVVVTVLTMAIPAAIAVAILRYRLYDIDRIISRTAAYAAVTAALVAVYALSVVFLQALLRPLAPDSDVAVAGSTLVVAALFGPVRRRVQAAVDRRFNRRRYDAARAVASFGQRLRDEVDLDEVAVELRHTVAATVQPRTFSLWLVGPEASR